MILDERNEFADATALSTAATGRALVGDVIDLGATAGGDIGDTLYLVIQVDTAVTSAGSATVSFELVSDAQAAIAVDGSATVHFATAAIPKATLIAGYQVCAVALPVEAPAYERYIGIVQNVGTAALTAGKINAFLTNDVRRWKAYADAL
jgi:hypothetical protein